MRLIRLAIGVLVVLGGAIVADAYYQSYKIYRAAREVTPKLSDARASLASGKIPRGDPFSAASAAAADAQQRIDHARFTFRVVGAIPFLDRPVEAVRFGVQAATEEAEAATILRGIVTDALGETSLSEGKAAGAPIFRNGVANVKLIRSLTPRLERVLTHLRAGDRAIGAIPEVPLLTRDDELKARAASESAQAISLTERALAATRLMPGFLGAGGETKTYYLALQNNADQRGTGGAVLAYAFLHITNGRFSLGEAGPIIKIDDKVTGIRGANLPSAMRWYIRNAHVNPRLANSNYSPNFPVNAEAWQSMIEQVRGIRVDGVIALDPFAVSHALRGTEPILTETYPGKITAGNVVSVTENDQYRLPKARQREFPGELMPLAFDRFIHSPDILGSLTEFGAALAEKHVQLWSSDQDQQSLLSELRWDGAMRSNPGDYLYLTHDKRNGNKADYYLEQDITYDVTILPSGAVDSTYRVKLTGDVPPGEVAPVAGRDIYGLNVAMENLYLPKAARFESVQPAGPVDWDIEPKGFVQHVEGDFRVFTKILKVTPGNPQTLVLTYTVPDVIKETPAGKVYQLTMQHQPMANPAEVTVHVRLPEGATIRESTGWVIRGSVATLHATLTRDMVTRIVF